MKFKNLWRYSCCFVGDIRSYNSLGNKSLGFAVFCRRVSVVELKIEYYFFMVEIHFYFQNRANINQNLLNTGFTIDSTNELINSSNRGWKVINHTCIFCCF